jgi:flagellar basal body-associated protein FliL
MKKGSVLIFALTVVFLVAIAAGVYFYLNKSGKIDFLIKKPADTSVTSQIVEPTATPTKTIEEEMKSIEISTDEGDLQELKAELGNL